MSISHVDRKNRRKKIAAAVKTGLMVELVAYQFGVGVPTVVKSCKENRVRIYQRQKKRVIRTIEKPKARKCSKCGHMWVFAPKPHVVNCEICRSINRVKIQVGERIKQIQKETEALERLERLERIENIRQLSAGHWANGDETDSDQDDQARVIQSARQHGAGRRGVGEIEKLIA